MASVTLLKTEAEQALSVQGLGLASARKPAFEQFAASGLPHRRIEAYHYTDLRALLKSAPPPAASGAPVAAISPFAALDALGLTMVAGFFEASLSSTDWPEGLTVHAETGVPDDGSAPGSVLSVDPVIALNAAFAASPVRITVAEEVALERPLFLRLVSMGVHASSPRVVIAVGAGAALSVIESHEGGAKGALVNAVVELRAGEGATVDHVRVNRLDEGTAALTTFGGALGKASVYRGGNFVAGSGLSRHQIFLRFEGEGAEATLSGAALLKDHQHADTTLVVDHAVPECVSREHFTHVLDENATGVFQGKIVVRPGAQQTDGKMMSRAIVLSDDATMNNKPELEIFADDVVCGHGATVGALDEDLLFYLRARGLPKKEAEALMLQAFVGEALEMVAHEGLRAVLETMVADWLKARG